VINKKVDGKEEKRKERVRFKFGIDRDLENEQVLEYAKSRDEDVINQVYTKRIPTIEYLSKRYTWVTEDAYSEICLVFTRCINAYGKNGKKTDFNTFFYTGVKNHFANLLKKKYRKKRTVIGGVDPTVFTFSLDESCDKEGDSQLLHEKYTTHQSSQHEFDKVIASYLEELSDGNESLIDFLFSIVDLSRRQIVRKVHSIKRTFPLITGDIEEDIMTGMGIPSNTYEIDEHKLRGKNISCRLKIIPKPFLRHISILVKQKSHLFDIVKG